MTGNGDDYLRHKLGRWWRAEGLPACRQLSDVQAGRVLDQIGALEWSGRPFTDPNA